MCRPSIDVKGSPWVTRTKYVAIKRVGSLDEFLTPYNNVKTGIEDRAGKVEAAFHITPEDIKIQNSILSTRIHTLLK